MYQNQKISISPHSYLNDNDYLKNTQEIDFPPSRKLSNKSQKISHSPEYNLNQTNCFNKTNK